MEIAVDLGDRELLKDDVEAFEPYVPWQRRFLENRLDCYRHLGVLRTAKAERDQQQFLEEKVQ